MKPLPAPFRIAVVGGGITGLTAAVSCAQRARSGSVRIELFESSSEFGGHIRTVRQDGFLIDEGPDSFITNKPAGIELCRTLGIEQELIPTNSRHRRALILKDGKTYPTPEGFNLMASANIRPLLATPLLSPAGKLRLLAEPFVPPRRADEGDDEESLADFARRRLGREAFERLVQPLVAGIYTADPERLSLAATLPRFPKMEQEHGSLFRGARAAQEKAEDGESRGSGARYGLFAGFRTGMSWLTQAAVAYLDDCQHVHLWRASPVEGLSVRSDGGWEVRCGGEESRFDAVIVTLPADRAAALLSPTDEALGESLRSIPYASSAIVITGHRRENVAHPLDAFGLVIPHIERRKVLAVSFASQKFPGRAPDGHVQLRTFVGGALDPEILAHDDCRLVQIVRDELAQLLGVRGEPVTVRVRRFPDAMPQYHLGHLRRVAEIETLAAQLRGLELAGNAYYGVGIPDAIVSGRSAAERILAAVPGGSSVPTDGN